MTDNQGSPKPNTRISVRLGELEVSLEGTQENVESLMGEKLFTFIQALQEAGGGISEPIVEIEKKESKTTEEGPPTEYPPPLGKPATLGDALTKLMVETGWGNKPRSLGEIRTALQTNALYYDKAAVATALVNLVKKGVLRRLGSRGDFSYVRA